MGSLREQVLCHQMALFPPQACRFEELKVAEKSDLL